MKIVIDLLLAVNIIIALLLTLGVMYMQSKSEGMGGILGGTSNISSRGIKGMDDQYRGYIKILAYAWVISVAIISYLLS